MFLLSSSEFECLSTPFGTDGVVMLRLFGLGTFFVGWGINGFVGFIGHLLHLLVCYFHLLVSLVNLCCVFYFRN